MRVLVTGGAGYIGSVMAALLLENGHDVVVADNLSRGHRDAVLPEAEFVEIDLLDTAEVSRVVEKGFDAVMHFAALALVGESMDRPDLYYRTNVTGSMNLLDAMIAGGIRKLVFSSTCAVYGVSQEMPMSENTPTGPINPYGASKLAVDRMISDYCEAFELAAVSLRYFNVGGASRGLGERHEPETHLVPNVLRTASGELPHVRIFGTDYSTMDGTCIRDYLHVEDLVRAHLLALLSDDQRGHRIYNLGSGTGFSVRQVIDAASMVTGKKIPTREEARRPGDPPTLVAASDKIRSELGWSPSRPKLEQIIEDAWEWQTSQKEGYP